MCNVFGIVSHSVVLTVRFKSGFFYSSIFNDQLSQKSNGTTLHLWSVHDRLGLHQHIYVSVSHISVAVNINFAEHFMLLVLFAEICVQGNLFCVDFYVAITVQIYFIFLKFRLPLKELLCNHFIIKLLLLSTVYI